MWKFALKEAIEECKTLFEGHILAKRCHDRFITARFTTYPLRLRQQFVPNDDRDAHRPITMSA